MVGHLRGSIVNSPLQIHMRYLLQEIYKEQKGKEGESLLR